MTTPARMAGQLTGRQLVLLGTVALHVLVFQVLSLTLGFRPFREPEERLHAFFVEDPQPQPPVPRRVQAGAARHESGPRNPEIPLTPPNIDDAIFILPPDPDGSTQQGNGEPPVSAVVEPPATGLSYTALRSTAEFYPPASIRLGEEGITQLRVCVSAAGALQGPPVVTAASGHARLDAAAQAWVSQALRFAPATVKGQPVDACKGFRVRFHLHD